MLYDYFSSLRAYWASEIRKWSWMVKSVFGDKQSLCFIFFYFQIFRGPLRIIGSYCILIQL